jgi:hypothetical protein
VSITRRHVLLADAGAPETLGWCGSLLTGAGWYIMLFTVLPLSHNTRGDGKGWTIRIGWACGVAAVAMVVSLALISSKKFQAKTTMASAIQPRPLVVEILTDAEAHGDGEAR